MRTHLAIALLIVSTVFIGCEDRSLFANKHNLAYFNPTSTSVSKDPLQIKGKVAIVWRQANGDISVDRFFVNGSFLNGPVDDHSPYPPEVYARTVDEIDTLIKIECRRFSGRAVYKSSAAPMGAPGTEQTFNNTICDTSINDYRTKTLLAKTTKGDEMTPSVLNDAQNAQGVRRSVIDYLKSVPLEHSHVAGANSQPTR